MTDLIRDGLETEAAGWVARMDAGRWSEADETALQAWLAADPRRAGVLLEAQAAWLSLDEADVLPVSATAAAQPRLTRRRLLAGGGAAIAASLAGGLFWLTRGTSYATELGEIRRVSLADGSSAVINTASRIAVDLEAARRDVRIDSGEAWFRVAHDPGRPFTVAAGRVRVQAIGTAFAVRRRDDGAEVLVSEGVVEAWAEGAEGHRVRLTAGRRAYVADNAAIRETPGEPASVERALAWRNGRIDLAGESLGNAVAEFNRYNRRQLVIADSAIAAEQLDGVFRTDDPEGFAAAIRSSLGVPVDLADPAEIRIGGRGG